MNQKTLKALNESIEKWKKIVNKTGVDKGEGNCPLCNLFVFADCSGCPVNEISKDSCDNTPYEEWVRHKQTRHSVLGWQEGWKTECRWCRHYAQKELDFLKSLLPKKNDRKTD